MLLAVLLLTAGMMMSMDPPIAVPVQWWNESSMRAEGCCWWTCSAKVVDLSRPQRDLWV